MFNKFVNKVKIKAEELKVKAKEARAEELQTAVKIEQLETEIIVEGVNIDEKAINFEANKKFQGFKVKEKGSELWDKFYPKFEHTVINGFLDVAEDKLKNDDDVKLVIHKLYELLPTIVRLTLSRDLFTEKVFAHKLTILEKVTVAKKQRLLSNNTELDSNLVKIELNLEDKENP